MNWLMISVDTDPSDWLWFQWNVGGTEGFLEFMLEAPSHARQAEELVERVGVDALYLEKLAHQRWQLWFGGSAFLPSSKKTGGPVTKNLIKLIPSTVDR
ncbi:hypothetical protein ACQ3I4_11115 [Zafaria sp. Z1313]|uniref:hypothetical protein n=1 Tax=Zafaria sp. Z1313 TaxID=3423202 RepID=UPI003D30335F